MKLSGAKQQTLFLTGVNAVVRALGLALRILMSRLMGAEAMGVMELASSVHMVAITPLTSGMPVAVSRLTAKEPQENQSDVLQAALSISRKLSLVLIPALWLFSPLIGRLMGDPRVVPSLWFTAPCILILGYSASLNGFCYGSGRSLLPALSELLEQLVRFVLCLLLLKALSGLTVPWKAAIPALATMTAECAGLFFVLYCLRRATCRRTAQHRHTRAIIQLALPATAGRMLQTLLRSATAVIIPLRLHASGLSASEATAQYGMLNGMVMPLMLLPGIFTSALSMVTIPRIAKAEENPSELKRLLRLSFLAVVPPTLLCAFGIYAAAPFLANVLYRNAELTVLFRSCAMQMVLFPIVHLLGSALSALGQQKRSLYISGIASAVTLALTWIWAGDPLLKLYGVIRAQYAGNLATILLSIFVLIAWLRQRKRQIW